MMHHAMTNEVKRDEIEKNISATGSGPASSDGFHKSFLWPFRYWQESTQTRKRRKLFPFSVVNKTVQGTCGKQSTQS